MNFLRHTTPKAMNTFNYINLWLCQNWTFARRTASRYSFYKLIRLNRLNLSASMIFLPSFLPSLPFLSFPSLPCLYSLPFLCLPPRLPALPSCLPAFLPSSFFRIFSCHKTLCLIRSDLFWSRICFCSRHIAFSPVSQEVDQQKRRTAEEVGVERRRAEKQRSRKIRKW